MLLYALRGFSGLGISIPNFDPGSPEYLNLIKCEQCLEYLHQDEHCISYTVSYCFDENLNLSIQIVIPFAVKLKIDITRVCFFHAKT
jgi:hypothetical protein